MSSRASTRAVMLLAALGLAAAGCGGTSDGITGTIQGKSVTVASAISNVVTGVTGATALIDLSTQPDACQALIDSRVTPGMGAFTFLVGIVDPVTGQSAAPLSPGTFVAKSPDGPPPADGRTVSGWFAAADAKCSFADQAGIVDGSLTLSAVADGSYVGSGDFTLDTGESISVAFDATSCGVVGSAVTSPMTCM